MQRGDMWRRTAQLLAAYLLLWWLLTGGDRHSWLVGGVTVGLALAVALSLPAPAAALRISPVGLLLFIPYFLWQSLRGGIDVARRAYTPRLPLDPALIHYPLRLPPGSARIFLLNTVSLLPGTLSADVSADTLCVHLLDKQRDPELTQLEQRVAGLFAISLQERP